MKKALCKTAVTKRTSQSTAKDVDKYIAAAPEPARSTLKKLRSMIRALVPTEATECLSYQIPTFKYKGPLVAYAAFTNHCSFFPMSSSLIAKFAEELDGFPTSKGTIRFPSDRPLPAALLKKFVKERITQNAAKEKRKAEKKSRPSR